MKSRRGRLQPVGRDRLLEELVHDSYKAEKKLPEPTRCPDCAAAYIKGRWTWAPLPQAHARFDVRPASAFMTNFQLGSSDSKAASCERIARKY